MNQREKRQDSAAAIAELTRQRPPYLAEIGVRLVREKPLGFANAVIVLILLLSGLLADVIAPYRYAEAHPKDGFSPPSSKYLLGTDQLGRDVLSRIIYGARVSMGLGLIVTILGSIGSAALGMISGYYGGKLDLALQRIVDAWMAFPGLVITISLVSVLGPGIPQLILVLTLFSIFPSSRVIRSAVFAIKENQYIEAAKAVGCQDPRILMQYVLPNIMATIIVLATVRLGAVILIEASLSFLGFGLPPPFPTWGAMLSGQARAYMLEAPWLAIWPGVALSLAVYSLNMFGDALRDLLDPRLRGAGGGRFS